jgi:flagellar protein FlaG
MYSTETSFPKITATKSVPAATPALRDSQGELLALAGDAGLPATAPPADPVNPAQLNQAVGNLREYAQNLKRNLQFSIDETSGQTVVRVVDPQTKEVIRQIPSEDALAMAERLRTLSAGPTGGLLQEIV